MTRPAWSRAIGWRQAVTACVLGVSVFVVACGSTDSPPQSQAEFTVASSTDSPPPSQAEFTAAQVYAANCDSCHGVDLRGTDKGPSLLSIVCEPNHHGDDSFRSAIANGAPQHHWTFGGMPPIEWLSDAQVDAVIAFVRAEQQRLGFEP